MSTGVTAASATPPLTGRAGIAGWCLYDWANSAFTTVITTFIFAAYFTSAVAENDTIGTAQWGYASSAAAILIAVLGPTLGAIADKGGRRKIWLFGFTWLGAALTMLLVLVRPNPEDALLALMLFVAAAVAMDMGQVFYNSMLPTLAPRAWLGRVSGWGWGLGYAGGLACLVAALYGFVESGAPWLGADTEQAEHVRATAVLVGLWVIVFSLPLLLITPDRRGAGLPAGQAVRQGLATLAETIRQVRRHAAIVRFLIAYLFYMNGLVTLFAFGGIYAAGTFDMDLAEVIRFGIALNVSAGLGAAAFAWVDDWIGPKRTVQIALAGLIVTGSILIVTESKLVFWIVGFLLGTFVGPAQAASRSFMARLVPKDMETEMFGLYALSGKATVFAGPLVLATVTQAFDSQRAGVASILVFFIVGLALLRFVPEPRR